MDEFKKELENTDTTEKENTEEQVIENGEEIPAEDLNNFDTTDNIDDIEGINYFGDDTVYFKNEDKQPFENPFKSDLSAFDKIDVSPIDDSKLGKSKVGIKVFSLILAAVVVLSGTCLGGYFLGKNSNKFIVENIEVDLEAKPNNTDEYTAAQVYNLLNESVVGIRVYNELGAVSDVSGVIYSEDGYVVTNDHSYSEVPAPKFKVYTFDGTEYDARYIAGDTVSDLAVLKINGSGFKPAVFGDSRQLVFGENVVAIGRPSDATASSSISKGIVSAVSRRVTTTSSYSARLIQTDSAINPGSSGGALVNMYGQVIGITSSKLAGVQYDAVGFAIPTVTMKRVVEQLIENGRVIDRAKLGISYTEINSVTAEMNNYPTTGLYIESIDEESDLYGKVTKGAVITHIGGKKITNDDMVLDIIEDCKAGDKIVVTIVLANGVSKDFNVTLRANVGQSSYSEDLKESDDSSGGTFDFPFGE